MSNSRHENDPFLVRALAMNYPSGRVLERHDHPWGQLVYALEGVMRVDTEDGIWVVPPLRAVWIPAGVAHAIAMSGRVAMRTLYLALDFASGLPARCGVLGVPPLLRELILLAVARGGLRADTDADRRVAELLLDQLRALPVAPLELPLPRDPRALRVALRLRDAPGERAPLDTVVRQCGASRRTLERLFQAETGLSLGRWRQQARLLAALDRLAHGDTVTQVALDVGYDSPSAFIAAFQSALGTTPGRYYGATATRRSAGTARHSHEHRSDA
jgi:AraC-like DNA-binding protein